MGAFALALITGGRLGDIFGRKRIFQIGVGGFTLTSALCGMAQTVPAWTFASTIGSLLIFVLFVVHQQGRTDSPLVELSLSGTGRSPAACWCRCSATGVG